LFGRLVDGGRLTVGVDAEGQATLDIQPLAGKNGDKSSKVEPAAAT
jgi:ATP-dependent Clp protease ATP-binding subunit ClpA